ncbi:uncharacterized protein METZ01_LOCUS88346, partial [marine metagenome]
VAVLPCFQVLNAGMGSLAKRASCSLNYEFFSPTGQLIITCSTPEYLSSEEADWR